jgi:hypothetical protein
MGNILLQVIFIGVKNRAAKSRGELLRLVAHALLAVHVYQGQQNHLPRGFWKKRAAGSFSVCGSERSRKAWASKPCRKYAIAAATGASFRGFSKGSSLSVLKPM